MGALAEMINEAELVKDAAISPRSQPREFLERLENLKQRAIVPPQVQADLARMSASPEQGGLGIPTTRQETTTRSLKSLGKIALIAAAAGAALRLIRGMSEKARYRQFVQEAEPYAGVPTREVHIPVTPKPALSKRAGYALPALAGATIAGPSVARAWGFRPGELISHAGEQISRGAEHAFAQTGDPLTSMWFLPAATAGSLIAAIGGYKALDVLFNKMRERRAARELSEAQQQFEEALREQYRQSELAEHAGVKLSSAQKLGRAIDGLAQAYVSGELGEQISSLQKLAGFTTEVEEPGWTHGVGAKAVGGYLALLTLLGLIGTAGGYQFVKSRETKRRRFHAAEEMLRRRQLVRPPTITVEPAS